MADSVRAREGFVPFSYPTLPKPCSTWYRIVGDLAQSSTRRPLICLHGGPGACHNYLQPLQELASKHDVTLIFYDQIGCGNSTRLQEKRLDANFWTVALFIAELENLLKHLNIKQYDLLGQSWGGMLGSEFAITQPTGLHKLILANSPASMKRWVESCNERRAQLPPELNATITKYEELADYDNQEYKDAVLVFYKRYMCLARGSGLDPFPEPVMQSLNLMEEDNTVYFTMNGPSEFTVIGNLKPWTVEGRLNKIIAPTLVYHGEFDEARLDAVKPFVDEIPDVTFKTILGTSHMSHVEKTTEVCQMIFDFLGNQLRS